MPLRPVGMESTRYRFDEFELDGATFELLRSGERVRLERLPMELLLLASRHGELVRRGEIAASFQTLLRRIHLA